MKVNLEKKHHAVFFAQSKISNSEVPTFTRERSLSSSWTNTLTISEVPDNSIEIKNLAKEFLAEQVSAAGVAYIVKKQGRLRRYVWMTAVVGCLAFMLYMTLNVILEYLKYPKMLIKEDEIFATLPFPGVTVCSLNPISTRYSSFTSIKKHLELRKLLQDAVAIPSNYQQKLSCTNEVLCRWSWFLESCECSRNPCHTEYCLESNETHCICSFAVCKDLQFNCQTLTDDPDSWERHMCSCNKSVDYPTPIQQTKRSNLRAVLSAIEDGEVREMIRLARNSQSFDLTDVEEGLMPSVNELYNYGVTFDSLVASCSFEQVHCHRDNFTVLYHPNYGRCYMFNYVGGEAFPKEPIQTHTYGSNSGLRLLLRVADQDVPELLRRQVGARIVIHDPRDLPFVSEFGVNVRPLDMTAVEVSMSTMERLGDPWGKCERRPLGERQEPYSLLNCEKKCGYQYMTKKCNCTMRHLLRGAFHSRAHTAFSICDLGEEKQKKCAFRVMSDIEHRKINCNCKPPCNETIYSYSVTSSELNVNYYRTVKAIRTLTTVEGGRLTYINASDEKSMIGVKVYYNTFQVSQQREVASYSWETLIANVGGNLGFFMGLTLITFLEVLEFVWDVLRTALHRSQPENKTTFFPSLPKDVSCHRKKKVHIVMRCMEEPLKIIVCPCSEKNAPTNECL